MIKIIKNYLQKLKDNPEVSDLAFKKGQNLYMNGQCLLLTKGKDFCDFLVDDTYDDFRIKLHLTEDEVLSESSKKKKVFTYHIIGCLLQLSEELERLDVQPEEGVAYTREGMIDRVMKERFQRAQKANYHIEFADNPYGEHLLTNEKGTTYRLTFRDHPNEIGYCSCPDYRTNKLGTCKHLMYAFAKKKGTKNKLKKPQTTYPFIEVYLDPQRDYIIRWFYPDSIEDKRINMLLSQYFDDDQTFREEEIQSFPEFMQLANEYKQVIIRPEVYEKVEWMFNQKLLEGLPEKHTLDYTQINAELYPYQKEGVEFATFREGAIIADEMGLGKTLQAISTAIMKKHIFGFERTLIICPASLKEQWKNEIEKFSSESVCIVEGKPNERRKLYLNSDSFFMIINYETVLRDHVLINKADIDLIILDEAQRIKNYETITARSIKRLRKKHGLVITGTPIENKLIDLFSIVEFLAPLWEFSYQHCYFDVNHKNKITGYYRLQELNERLRPILIRREKREVIQQLPKINELTIPVEMADEQKDYHASFAKGVARIIKKKFISTYDMQRLMLLLNQMRMACNSTFLIDKETNISPKLTELRFILEDQLNLTHNTRKVIIFSEWTRMTALIGKLLRDLGIGYVELNGKVPVNKRQELVKEFFENSDCQVFISTEAGGSGLNLQVADTVINFELPWNPAKKNQRIGRIDRIGQSQEHVTIINLVTKDSIEMRIASGLVLKQHLFEGALIGSSKLDTVDFSAKGRSQFIKQVEAMIEDFAGSRYRDILDDEAIISSEPEQEESWEEYQKVEPIEQDLPASKVSKPISDGRDVALETTSNIDGKSDEHVSASQTKEIERVMNQGMDFLSGIFKMATGKELSASDQRVEVDEETGEVIMRFKIPT